MNHDCKGAILFSPLGSAIYGAGVWSSYWSSTKYDSDNFKNVQFDCNDLKITVDSSSQPSYGCGVRLIRDY